MTFTQLEKLIRLARCQLLVADTLFIKKLEARDCDSELSQYEKEKLNKLYLNYSKQIKRYERMEV